MEVKTDNGSLMMVEFKNHTQPVMTWSKGRDWISWGECNNYPDYLIELYNRNPIHGALVKGKSQYVFGEGLQYSGAETVLSHAKVKSYLDFANRFETWDEVYEKTCRHFELFNGWAWQIIPNRAGTRFEIFNIEIAKLRKSKCGKKVIYCDAWLIDNNGTIEANSNPEKDSSYKEFDLFHPNIRTTSVFYFKLDVPASMRYGDYYPIPDYSGAVMDIETHIEISNHHYHNIKNGMFASSILSLFNGEPEDSEKKKIKKMFDKTYTGTTNSGKVMINFVNPGGTPADIKTLTQSDLDKLFEQLGKTIKENIFTAHKCDPLLFGVMTEGSLSDTGGAAVINKWDKFVRTYIKNRQSIILNQIKWLGEIQGFDLKGLEVKQTSPVSIELPQDPEILFKIFDTPEERLSVKKAYANKFGIDLTDVVIENVQMESLPVNDNVKNLSMAEYRRLQSYISKYKAGKITYEEASHFIKGYGLGDDYVKLALGEKKFSKQDRTDELLSLFEKFAIDDNDDPILSEQYFHTEKEALKIELKAMKFEEEVSPELKNQVIDLLTGDPMATPDKLAKMLGVNPLIILAAITALIAGGYLIETVPGSYQPTEKAINKEVEKVETEVYTVFSYVTRPDVPEAESSRPLCRKLLKLSREGKRWTRDGIESITNEFGEDAWTYRGGFYTNPNTQETTPYCRHIWKAIIKTRKKGGKRG